MSKTTTIAEEISKKMELLEKARPENNVTAYKAYTVPYTAELYQDICESYLDYHQTDWTVCGAQDPAVIHLGSQFAVKHPEWAPYAIVRIKERYLNAWNSATLLEFSNEEMTDQEYDDFEKVMEEEEK